MWWFKKKEKRITYEEFSEYLKTLTEINGFSNLGKACAKNLGMNLWNQYAKDNTISEKENLAIDVLLQRVLDNDFIDQGKWRIIPCYKIIAEMVREYNFFAFAEKKKPLSKKIVKQCEDYFYFDVWAKCGLKGYLNYMEMKSLRSKLNEMIFGIPTE